MKQLTDLISTLTPLELTGPADPLIRMITLDSREAGPDSLFCALAGSRADGHAFMQQAISSGAAAVLCERLPDPLPQGVTCIRVSDTRAALGAVAAAFYDHPSEQLKLVGITGTNGKTSIATWLHDLFTQLGYPCGLLSTVRTLILDQAWPSTHTTPDVITLNHWLRRMVDAGCGYAFMEVSSHALDQQRTAGIRFAGAVFTNLTRDHLDYHGDFRAYLEAKKKLFDQLGQDAFALVNADDRNGPVMVQNTRAAVHDYSLSRHATYHARVLEQHPEGMLLFIDKQELWVPVIGTYNAQNLLAVYATAVLCRLSQTEILTALSRLRAVEGRLEVIALGNRITGVVDYAHTPDALVNVLTALQELKEKKARIITVIGAGGDRDPGKRQDMTRAALHGSEQVILTSDNPRTENPEHILDDLEAAVTPADQARVLRITDRRAAIKTAVTLARPGDVVLVAGKGHERYQEINGVKHHFDDAEELKKLKTKE